ncbi:uncharacterized protein LOC129803471 [Phlebotomus papatasi]|uniref:uncharacterized protein LOC129803471 n=1 Tax=Phlebotomus papatasi TaxID=29031 RepID=UPI0024833D46|nr:uncharacterized protein LOC129803471 [Phlebotomus papatasi]
MYYLMCGVKNCRYRHYRRLPKNISLYMLPRDAPLEMKNSWRQVCKGRLIACSEHFDEDDFLKPKVHPGAASSAHGMAKPLKHFVVPKIRNRVNESRGQDSSGMDKSQKGTLEKNGKSENIIILDSDNEDVEPVQEEDPLAPDRSQDNDSGKVPSKDSSASSSIKSPLGINIEKAKALNAMLNQRRNAAVKDTEDASGSKKTPMLLSDLIKYLKATPENPGKGYIGKSRKPATPATVTSKTATVTTEVTTVPKPSTSTSSPQISSNVIKRKAEADPDEPQGAAKKPHVNAQEDSKEKLPRKVVLREVKLARKNFGNVLGTIALHKLQQKTQEVLNELPVAQNPQNANQVRLGTVFLQGKDVTVKTMSQVKNESTEDKKPISNVNLKIVSIRSLGQEAEAKAGPSREVMQMTSLEELRKKHVQKPQPVPQGMPQAPQANAGKPGQIKVVPLDKLTKPLSKIPPAASAVVNFAQKTQKTHQIASPVPSESAKATKEPQPETPVIPNKKPQESSSVPDEDDDVIIMPQKIDVIDIDGDSDEEKQQKREDGKCDPNKCKLLRKLQHAEQKLTYLQTLKEKLTTENKALKVTEEKRVHKHTLVKDFVIHLPKILSENQNNILFGNRQVVWQHSEIQDALVLRHLSPELYMYLREELTYPLPSVTALNSWEIHYPNESLSIKQYAMEILENQSDSDGDTDIEEL